MQSITSPSSIAHTLILRILRGDPAPGGRLPGIRELAKTFGVTPATIQRVISRLESHGLVTSRQGSGIRVNDPVERGDISLIPFWLEATLDQPEVARRILSDLLEVRRLVALQVLSRHREAIVAEGPALQQLAHALETPQELDALVAADMAFIRALLKTTGNLVLVSILNTMERVLHHIPEVAEAMYADPSANMAAMLQVISALSTGRDDAHTEAGALLKELDDNTIARFVTRLSQRRGT